MHRCCVGMQQRQIKHRSTRNQRRRKKPALVPILSPAHTHTHLRPHSTGILEAKNGTQAVAQDHIDTPRGSTLAPPSRVVRMLPGICMSRKP
eukprot:731444-Pelagomonas_calceolata.AAC.2